MMGRAYLAGAPLLPVVGDPADTTPQRKPCHVGSHLSKSMRLPYVFLVVFIIIGSSSLAFGRNTPSGGRLGADGAVDGWMAWATATGRSAGALKALCGKAAHAVTRLGREGVAHVRRAKSRLPTLTSLPRANRTAAATAASPAAKRHLSEDSRPAAASSRQSSLPPSAASPSTTRGSSREQAASTASTIAASTTTTTTSSARTPRLHSHEQQQHYQEQHGAGPEPLSKPWNSLLRLADEWDVNVEALEPQPASPLLAALAPANSKGQVAEPSASAAASATSQLAAAASRIPALAQAAWQEINLVHGRVALVSLALKGSAEPASAGDEMQDHASIHGSLPARTGGRDLPRTPETTHTMMDAAAMLSHAFKSAADEAEALLRGFVAEALGVDRAGAKEATAAASSNKPDRSVAGAEPGLEGDQLESGQEAGDAEQQASSSDGASEGGRDLDQDLPKPVPTQLAVGRTVVAGAAAATAVARQAGTAALNGLAALLPHTQAVFSSILATASTTFSMPTR